MPIRPGQTDYSLNTFDDRHADGIWILQFVAQVTEDNALRRRHLPIDYISSISFCHLDSSTFLGN